ncbi:hypothetical protein ScPMuIL_016866 [Solemya velum]
MSVNSVAGRFGGEEDGEEKDRPSKGSTLLDSCRCDGFMCNCCVPVVIPQDELGCIRVEMNALTMALDVTCHVGPIVLYRESIVVEDLPEFCIPLFFVPESRLCVEIVNVGLTASLGMEMCSKISLRLPNKAALVYEPNCLNFELPGGGITG